jgi:hypothetical protein
VEILNASGRNKYLMGLGREYGSEKPNAIFFSVLKEDCWNATELLVSVSNIINGLGPF